MSDWLKANGKIIIGKDNFIRIITNLDFCKYYRWLFTRYHYFTIKSNLPKHHAHINIFSPKIYPDIKIDKALSYHDKNVTFEYDFTGNYGGFTKGFLNFWMDVKCKEADEIYKLLDIPEKDGKFNRFHLTILNTKKL
jgi:hypothetical protein